MNWEQVEANWGELRGKAREEWTRLTEEDLLSIGGDREELAGKLQERYGKPRVEARREVDRWRKSL